MTLLKSIYLSNHGSLPRRVLQCLRDFPGNANRVSSRKVGMIGRRYTTVGDILSNRMVCYTRTLAFAKCWRSESSTEVETGGSNKQRASASSSRFALTRFTRSSRALELLFALLKSSYRLYDSLALAKDPGACYSFLTEAWKEFHEKNFTCSPFQASPIRSFTIGRRSIWRELCILRLNHLVRKSSILRDIGKGIPSSSCSQFWGLELGSVQYTSWYR